MTLQERYQAFSNKKLIRVLLQASEYQPEASEVAQDELKKRNLDDQILQELKNSVRNELEVELQQEKERASRQEEKVLETITLLKRLSPVQPNVSIGERLTVLIGLIYLILYIEPFYYDLKFLYYELKQLATFSIATIFTLGNVILFPLTLFHYSRRTKGGWILMMGILSYDIFHKINFLITTIYNVSDPLILSMNSGSINYFWLILPLVVYTTLIILLFQKVVWKQFNVTIVQQILTFCTGFLFLHGLYFFVYYLIEGLS